MERRRPPLDKSLHMEPTMERVEQMEAKTTKASMRDYYQITKPRIVYENMLGTVAGFMVAMGGVSFTVEHIWILIYSLVGIGFVIAGSTTLNTVYDRDIDGYMARTRHRPIHTGRISVRAGAIYGVALSSIGVIILALLVNVLSALLAFVGLIVYVFIYTMWLKRTSTINTVVGGISGAMPTMMGYVAVTGTLDIVAWIIFAILFLWQPPHFLALALRRVDDYRNAGIPMLPVVKGYDATKKQIIYWTLAMIPATIMLFTVQAVGFIYLIGAIILNAIYLWGALRGLFIEKEKEKKWTYFMFKYSVVYLALLYVLMMIDAK